LALSLLEKMNNKVSSNAYKPDRDLFFQKANANKDPDNIVDTMVASMVSYEVIRNNICHYLLLLAFMLQPTSCIL
jgi:hypothetical protein